MCPIQLLRHWAWRPAHVFVQAVNAEDALLSRIGIRILLVTPASIKVQPVHWCTVVIRTELLRTCVIFVEVCAQRRIPERAVVSRVVQKSDWKIDIWDTVTMVPANGVVGVGVLGGVADRLLKKLGSC